MPILISSTSYSAAHLTGLQGRSRTRNLNNSLNYLHFPQHPSTLLTYKYRRRQM
jgi:hypothetical protein